MGEIYEKLKSEVKNDVVGKKEVEVENKVINYLQEIKDQVMLEDEYVHDLYRKEFKAKLIEKEHTWIGDTFKKLNDIKLRVIERELKKREGEILKPNRVTRNCIYPVCGISMDINKNGKTKNIVKGVIDELMALPDMAAEIIKHPVDFAKGMARIITNPGQMIKSILESFTDAFTQGLKTPEAQYRTGRSATLIVLSFFPGGLGKGLLNVAKKSPRLMKKASIATKRTKVEIRQATKPIESKSVITRKPRAEKIEKQVGNNTKAIEKQGAKLGNKAKQGAEKKAIEAQKKHVEKAAKKNARWAERELIRQEALKTFRTKMREYLSKISLKNNPLSKVRAYARKRTVEKLDGVREGILKKAYPKFYKDLKTLESKTPGLKNAIEKASKDLEKAIAKRIELNRKITDLEGLVKKGGFHHVEGIWKGGKGLSPKELKDLLKKYKSDLSILEKQTEGLNKQLYGAAQRLAIHNRVVKKIKEYPTNQMIQKTNIAGQLAAEVQYAIEGEMDYEIEEARKQAVQTLQEINKEIDVDYSELVKGDEKGIETGKADVSDIDLHIPNGCDLSKVDPNLYTITVIGKASKTGSRALNEKLALQRANNARQKIILQYGLDPFVTKFDVKVDLQLDHQDKMNEDVMKWQGVDVKVTPKPGKEREYRDALVETNIDNQV